MASTKPVFRLIIVASASFSRRPVLLKQRLFVFISLMAFILPATGAFAAAASKKVSLEGTLVDVACATERAGDLEALGIKHTKKCLQMPDCDKSGFAVLTADDKVIPFDAAGNDLARKLIAQT